MNVDIASAIQEAMHKLGLSYLKDKQREAVERRGYGSGLAYWLWKITNICYSTICI